MEEYLMKIAKYSIGTGDRFAHQAGAQLKAVMEAAKDGKKIAIVWNKSHREHKTIGSKPEDVRVAAESAVKKAGYTGEYYLDADHINISNVHLFIPSCNFFTLDVADFTGKSADEAAIKSFMQKYRRFAGKINIPGASGVFDISEETIHSSAKKYLLAVQEAAKIYNFIKKKKGAGSFVTEVSMDETDMPQTPVELFFILGMISDSGIPAQTIAPKFTGRFNKGVDYVGSVPQFTKEFSDDIAVIEYAKTLFKLEDNLKLSVHSGSDKFSIYGPIKAALTKFGAGVHLKTAGTTWLEEIIGLALGGGEGLAVAVEVYRAALSRFDELCGPYATVIDIDKKKLPSAAEVSAYTGSQFMRALRHDQSCPDYNPDFRQLLHVGYKVAAEMGSRYYDALKKYSTIVAENVTENILERHIKKVF